MFGPSYLEIAIVVAVVALFAARQVRLRRHRPDRRLPQSDDTP